VSCGYVLVLVGALGVGMERRMGGTGWGFGEEVSQKLRQCERIKGNGGRVCAARLGDVTAVSAVPNGASGASGVVASVMDALSRPNLPLVFPPLDFFWRLFGFAAQCRPTTVPLGSPRLSISCS